MRAAVYRRFGGPEVLEIADRPIPDPGPGQVRIAVRAVGVEPTDTKARRGLHGDELPPGTGRGIAGVIDEVGPDAPGAVGDRVFGAADEEAGAAEHALSSAFAPIPAVLGFADAAALPVVVETATRSLRVLGVGPGTTLLVNGASGGIGSTAVQLAIASGARVIGVAGPSNQDLLRGLGAEPVVYGPGLAERVRALAPDGVDRALDIAGNGVLPELVDLAGGAEHVVTIADVAGARKHGVHFTTGEDGRALDALGTIGAVIDAGRFWLPVDRTFPLERIADAHRLVEAGHPRGKVVLLVH